MCEPRAVLNVALGPDTEKALRAVSTLRNDLERVERIQVASALDQGWSWARIARAVGVSRQAVHSKYSGQRPAVPNRSVEQRPTLSGEARLAVLIGRSEAAARGDVLAGTEHVLAGLLQQGEGEAAALLKGLGATVPKVRAALDALTPSGISQGAPSSLPLSRRASRALQLAAGYAARSGASQLSDLHLLCALVDDPSANAVHVLRAIGVGRQQLITALNGTATPCEPTPERGR
jgi:hypothetical protein